MAEAALVLADLVEAREAIPLYERSASIWSHVLEVNPSSDPHLRANLALSYRSLSNAFVALQDYQRGIELAGKARVVDQELLDANPASPQAQLSLSFDLGAAGYAYYSSGDYKNAAQAERAVVELRKKIVAANPDDFRAAERLAYALQFLADAEEQSREPGPANQSYRQALEIYARLRRKGMLVRSSLFTYARSIFRFVRLEEKNPAFERCVWMKTMAGVLKEYQQGTLAPGEISEAEQMHQAAQSCAG